MQPLDNLGLGTTTYVTTLPLKNTGTVLTVDSSQPGVPRPLSSLDKRSVVPLQGDVEEGRYYSDRTPLCRA